MKKIVQYGNKRCSLCSLSVAEFVNGRQNHDLGYIHDYCLCKLNRSPPPKLSETEHNPVRKNNI